MPQQTPPRRGAPRWPTATQAQAIAALTLTTLLAACGGGSEPDNTPAARDTDQSRASAQSLVPLPTLETGAGWVAAPAAPSEVVNHGASVPAPDARVFYVDAASSAPTSQGTLAAPWKTLAEVQSNKANFKGGDAILLKCGSVWREKLQMGAAADPAPDLLFNPSLLLGAYGANCSDTNRPVIKGSVLVDKTGWQRFGKGFNYTYVRSFTASASAPLPRLFLDGQPLTQARFPNKEDTGSEFATLVGVPVTVNGKASFSQTTFVMGPNELSRLGLQKTPAPDLIGATVHIRTVPWEIETRTIDAFNAQTGLVTLKTATKHPITNGAGYILEGKAWLLGKAGQWAYDRSAQKLYWWAPQNKAPANVPGTLEATSLDMGLQIYKLDGLTIERIRFEQQGAVGIDINRGKHITVTDIESVHPHVAGVSSMVSNAITVQDSKVAGAGDYGLLLQPTTNAMVRRNVITDTGLLARAGGSAAAIVARSFTKDFPLVVSSISRVEENRVIRSANTGIFFSNDAGTTVHQNTVIQPCARLTDCGGIQTFTEDPLKTLQYIDVPADLPDGATVSSNVVVGAKSNLDGSFLSSSQSSVRAGTNQAMGIYLDELTARTKVTGNTVANTEVGIYLHLARFNTIANNTVVNVSHASFLAGQDKNERVPRQNVMRGNQVLNNRFFSHRPLDASKLQSAAIYAIDAKPVYAQLWENTQDGDQSFFTSADGPPNVSSGNTTYTTSNVLAKTWRVDVNNRLASRHGGVWGVRQKAANPANPDIDQFDLADWQQKSAASTDTETSPVAFKPYLLAQPEPASLVRNGNFDVDLSEWLPNPYPVTTPPASLTWVATAPCSTAAPCGRWQAHLAGHFLASNTFPVTGSDLYLLRYTLKAGANGALHRANVRKTGPTDYGTLGFNFLNWLALAPNQEIQVEQFFKASESSPNATLSLTATDGSASKDIYVSQVSLRPVTTLPTFRSQTEVSVTVANAADVAVTRTCAEWKLDQLNNCALRDGETGAVVTWPLTVPARSAKVFYFDTPAWLDN